MAKKKKAAAKGRTETLPGIPKPHHIAEITNAAIEYESVRDTRIEYLAQEIEANEKLVELMKKHDLTEYRDLSLDPPVVVAFKVSEKLRAKVTREKMKE